MSGPFSERLEMLALLAESEVATTDSAFIVRKRPAPSTVRFAPGFICSGTFAYPPLGPTKNAPNAVNGDRTLRSPACTLPVAATF